MITMSATDRLLQCQHWRYRPHSRETTERSELGTAAHAYLFAVLTQGVEAARAHVLPEFQSLMDTIEISELPACRPDRWAGEVALAWDWRADTARELGRGLARAYVGLGPTELPGTPDLVGLTDDDAVAILDWKVGWIRSRPKQLGQLRSYALAACRAYGRSRARVGTVNPLLNRVVWDELTEEDLAEHAVALANALDADRDETPVQGPWCTYCPAFDACDAKRALLCAAADQLEVNATVTDEVCVRALEQLQMLEGAIKRAWKLLEERATAAPFHGPDGRVWGPVQEPGNDSIKPEAYAWLKEKYGVEVATTAAKFEVTKGRLTSALRAHGRNVPGFKLAEAERTCLSGLRQAGLIEKKPRVSFKWHEATERLEAGHVNAVETVQEERAVPAEAGGGAGAGEGAGAGAAGPLVT